MLSFSALIFYSELPAQPHSVRASYLQTHTQKLISCLHFLTMRFISRN